MGRWGDGLGVKVEGLGLTGKVLGVKNEGLSVNGLGTRGEGERDEEE